MIWKPHVYEIIVKNEKSDFFKLIKLFNGEPIFDLLE